MKTRFVIRCEGEFRKLFSIMERPSGDLIVPLTSPDRYVYLDGREDRYVVQKYTFHRSLKADPPAVTFTQTVRLQSGDVLTSSQLRHRNSGGGFLAYVFGRICPNLALDKFTVIETNDVRLVPLHPDDMGRSTLVYHIIVADPEFDENLMRVRGLGLLATTFSYFKVIVLFGFIFIPAINRGFMSHAGTSLARVNGVQPDAPTPEMDHASMTVDQVVEKVRSSAATFNEEMYRRHRDFIDENGYDIPSKETALALKHTFPDPSPSKAGAALAKAAAAGLLNV